MPSAMPQLAEIGVNVSALTVHRVGQRMRDPGDPAETSLNLLKITFLMILVIS